LLLGLPDDAGRLRVAGRTGSLTLPPRRELGALLIPAERTHPWPDRIPSSRLGQLPGELVDYTPTEPLLVVEVDADVCFEHHRWRHPTPFRRVRAELDPTDLSAPRTAKDCQVMVVIAGHALRHGRLRLDIAAPVPDAGRVEIMCRIDIDAG
jgi:hypothetical protein